MTTPYPGSEGQTYHMHIETEVANVTLTASVYFDANIAKFDPVWEEITDYIAAKMNAL